MIKNQSTKCNVRKISSILIALALLASMFPLATFKRVAYAENQDSLDISTIEITDDSVKGRIKSQEEIDEAYSCGGNVNIVDKSDIRYNVNDTGSSGDASLSEDSLPESVDLRTTGTVTSVKNQDKTGTCWSWAANAAAETSIAKASNKTAVDLSAFQTAWMGYEPLPTSTTSLSGTEIMQAGEGTYIKDENQTDDAQKADQYRYRLNGGGNSIRASGLFMQGVGVTTATDIPFPEYALSGSIVKSADKPTFAQRKHSIARLTKQNELGSLINTKVSAEGVRTFDSTNATVLKRIKTQLSQGNAVKISYWAGQSNASQPLPTTYYNSENHAICTIQPSNMFLNSNHAVCIVGYDDNYPSLNFNSGYQPEGNGAFIVKNSWGSSWGDNGYFYLSYYDQSVDDASTYDFDISSYTGSLLDTAKEVVDQYDYLQATLIALNRVKWYSNVYTASHKQQLHNIATYYAPDAETLTYKVYKLKPDATSPKDVEDSLDEPAAEGTYQSDYEGYVSIKLDNSITLNKGDKYAIWFSQQGKDGAFSAPVGCQVNESKYVCSKAIVNKGESFCSDNPSSTWESQTASGSVTSVSMDNYCVKGYATILPLTITFDCDGATQISSQTITEGSKVTKPADPTRSDCIFGGWYTDESFTTEYNFDSTVDKDITLYAKWIEKESMARLYNKWTGEHFYTANLDEKQNLVNIGWSDEGTGWIALSSSNTPVYRLYNKYVAGGDHHYTTSSSERDTLVEAGWSDEGVGWYSDDDKSVALYRLYNPFAVSGTHHYTTSRSEADALINLGWRDENVAWYGFDS